MGTVFSFDIRSPGVSARDLDSAVDWLHHVDATFSTYRPDSVISRLRRNEIPLASLDREVTDVLRACADMSEVTDGFFSAYHDGELDPSGYVKGWAVRGASEILRTAGSTNHCVNGGGDVLCMGRPAPDRLWNIGIVDPHDGGTIIRTVVAEGPVAVATSGSSERGGHIRDPHTGRPATGLASVSVAARDLVLADCCATAACAMGASRARAWLAGRPDLLAVLVTDGGEVEEIGSL